MTETEAAAAEAAAAFARLVAWAAERPEEQIAAAVIGTLAKAALDAED